jgi:hypothetical protein
MITGHFGLAAMVKARAPYVPLWALMVATVWLDIVFVPLLLAGIETFQPAAGTHGGYGNAIIHAPYTHSLLGALVLSALFGAAFARAWGTRAAIVLGLVSLSHWLLDLIVHRTDLPLWPTAWSTSPLFGFGLWRIPWATAGVEFILVAAGSWWYWRAALAISATAPTARRRANLVASLMLVFGLVVLGLDVGSS